MRAAMKRSMGFLLVCALLLVVVGCTLVNPGSGPAALHPAPAYLPPDRAVDKWDRCEKVHTYNADNLYLYLSGDARQYKEYGFEELAQTKYRVGLEGTERLNVEVHRMRDKVAAFGIYSVEHNKDAEPVEVGAQACATDLSVDMVKGVHFVRLKLDKAVPESRDSLVRLAAYIAGKLPGDNSLPTMFAAFPEKNRVPHSEQYLATRFFERSYLQGGYRVLYEVDGKRFSMFLVNAGDPDEAIITMVSFRMSFNNVGSSEAMLPKPWLRAFWGLDPQLGRALVFQKGRYIGGTMGLNDRKLAIQMSLQLANRLP